MEKKIKIALYANFDGELQAVGLDVHSQEGSILTEAARKATLDKKKMDMKIYVDDCGPHVSPWDRKGFINLLKDYSNKEFNFVVTEDKACADVLKSLEISNAFMKQSA